jgi:hypothetical protein
LLKLPFVHFFKGVPCLLVRCFEEERVFLEENQKEETGQVHIVLLKTVLNLDQEFLLFLLAYDSIIYESVGISVFYAKVPADRKTTQANI